VAYHRIKISALEFGQGFAPHFIGIDRGVLFGGFPDNLLDRLQRLFHFGVIDVLDKIAVSAFGTHYGKEGLGNAFREAIVAAGIPVSKKGSDEKGYSAHGLRKASATIAAESGATESELNAMFGWSGYQMAQLYTKKADRKRLAARALAKWTRPSSDHAGQSELVHLRLEKERA
jgi:integrase